MPQPVQVVLQGGGARLSDLLAVGEALHELHSTERIIIKRVAGTSAGSIVACMLGSGIRMSHFKEFLRREAPDALPKLFHTKSKPNIYFRIMRGRPILNQEVFRELLENLFVYEGRQYAEFRQLPIPTFVVTTDLRESRRDVRGVKRDQDSFITAMVDSCALPFAFRTYRDRDLHVDGGICANLPGLELIDKVAEDGPRK
jgi:predicted acylesterase/phospholipase RssA